MNQSEEDRKAVIELQHSWAKALENRDVATVQALAADDFVGVGPGGGATKKSGLLGSLRSRELEIHESKIEDLDVKIIGDTAITMYRSSDKGQFKGEPISGQFRWIDVAVKRSGKWVCLASQGTKIKETGH